MTRWQRPCYKLSCYLHIRTITEELAKASQADVEEELSDEDLAGVAGGTMASKTQDLKQRQAKYRRENGIGGDWEGGD